MTVDTPTDLRPTGLELIKLFLQTRYWDSWLNCLYKVDTSPQDIWSAYKLLFLPVPPPVLERSWKDFRSQLLKNPATEESNSLYIYSPGSWGFCFGNNSFRFLGPPLRLVLSDAERPGKRKMTTGPWLKHGRYGSIRVLYGFLNTVIVIEARDETTLLLVHILVIPRQDTHPG